MAGQVNPPEQGPDDLQLLPSQPHSKSEQ